MGKDLGVRIKCRHCKTFFVICISCFRGQVYCGIDCRSEARKLSRRRRQRIYQKSPKGRLNHKLKQRRYRNRLLEKKRVTDHSDLCRVPVHTRSSPTRSTCSQKLSQMMEPRHQNSCILCQSSVNQFPANGCFTSTRAKILLKKQREAFQLFK